MAAKRKKSVPNGKKRDNYYSILHFLANKKPRAVSERDSLRKNASALGMKIMHEVPGDGSCFFHSIVSQFPKLGIDKYSNIQSLDEQARLLRRDAVEFVQYLVYWKQQEIANVPNTIHQALKATSNVKTTFPNITTMLHIAATLPITSCECERSFSSLRRLKTFNRTTLGEDRLNGLALLAIHRHQQINLDDAADMFINAKPRRMQFASFLANWRQQS